MRVGRWPELGWISGQLLATYSRRIWLLLWLLILIAGDNSRRTSQRPRNESMGLTGKTCGWGKSRITDERAIFHPMTRVWTTYRVGNSESMDARPLPLPNREIERPNSPFNGLRVLRQSGLAVTSRPFGSNLPHAVYKDEGFVKDRVLLSGVCNAACGPEF